MKATFQRLCWVLTALVLPFTVDSFWRVPPWSCLLLILPILTSRGFQTTPKQISWNAHLDLVMPSSCQHSGGMKCSHILIHSSIETLQWTSGEYHMKKVLLGNVLNALCAFPIVYRYEPLLTKEFPCAECRLNFNLFYRQLLEDLQSPEDWRQSKVAIQFCLSGNVELYFMTLCTAFSSAIWFCGYMDVNNNG